MFAKLFPNLAKSNIDPKKVRFRLVARKLDLQVQAENYGQSVFIPMDPEQRNGLPDPESVKEWIREMRSPDGPSPKTTTNEPKTTAKQPTK